MNTYGIEKWGILNPLAVHRNLAPAVLTEHALRLEDSKLTDTGALLVYTGKYTGRSPKDRFIVDEPSITNEIDWGKENKKFSQDNFSRILAKVTAYLNNREIFIYDGCAGADPKHRINVRVINEYPSHNLFMRDMLIKLPDLEGFSEDFTIISAPGLNLIPSEDGTNSEAFIAVSFEKKLILIAGTKYCGEMKKSVFSIMNYLLPKKKIVGMHCSANMALDGTKSTALFFGLSGTGKTTLSADPNRGLIGDDEHGWSDDGIFNFEGGCYAKCIDLTVEKEPDIYRAIKHGAVVENVVIDNDTRSPDYKDQSLTENTRVAYPLEFIPNAVIPSVGSHPKTVIFLTADAFGVLPPVAKLSLDQAKYYFISGYTSKLAGTERGIVDPESTFSTCFGSPFLPLHSSIYANLLGDQIEKYGSTVYLINTGWAGGPYGVGKRMSLKVTRAIVTAALDGSLEKVKYETEPFFGLSIPTSCTGVEAELLNPKKSWKDQAEYDRLANKLAGDFFDNFAKYSNMPAEITNAGPKKK